MVVSCNGLNLSAYSCACSCLSWWPLHLQRSPLSRHLAFIRCPLWEFTQHGEEGGSGLKKILLSVKAKSQTNKAAMAIGIKNTI